MKLSMGMGAGKVLLELALEPSAMYILDYSTGVSMDVVDSFVDDNSSIEDKAALVKHRYATQIDMPPFGN
jgi:hypothetical protein